MATITTIRIGPIDRGRRMSLEEFREADEEEGYRYELARGVLEVTEVPNNPHRQMITNLYDAMARYRQAHPGVILSYGGGSEFRLWLPGMSSGRNPDLSVVLRGAPKDYRGRHIPALVAEVVSPGAEERDYFVKRQEYLLYGILEYWIVDPQKRRVTVLVRQGDIWQDRVFEGAQPIKSVVLPRLAATVADLWVDLEEETEEDPAGPENPATEV